MLDFDLRGQHSRHASTLFPSASPLTRTQAGPPCVSTPSTAIVATLSAASAPLFYRSPSVCSSPRLIPDLARNILGRFGNAADPRATAAEGGAGGGEAYESSAISALQACKLSADVLGLGAGCVLGCQFLPVLRFSVPGVTFRGLL